MTQAPFFKEWIANDRVLAYRIFTTNRNAADMWFEDLATVFREWPNERPLHLILDLHRAGGGIISANALIRARQVSHVRPDVHGRTALVVAGGLSMQLVSSLLRSGLASGARERMMFSSESAALEWLLRPDPTRPE